MVAISHTRSEIFKLISVIPDPEIPVISIQELGILREVEVRDNLVIVDITPTYSGCPAMKMIEDLIRETLYQVGIENVKVNHVFTPPWTTDWISDEAKEKLQKFGIAPPEKTTSDKGVLLGKTKTVVCPHCGSRNTELVSQFGATACKALYKCFDCREPFEYFKCI
jgi:ring-1,2-phenylacetyl-CoA epoxidase subunit PaaD